MTGRGRLVRSTGILADQKAEREALAADIDLDALRQLAERGGIYDGNRTVLQLLDHIAALIEREHGKAVAPVKAVIDKMWGQWLAAVDDEVFDADHRWTYSGPGDGMRGPDEVLDEDGTLVATCYGLDYALAIVAAMNAIPDLRAACDPAAATTHDRAVENRSPESVTIRVSIDNPGEERLDALTNRIMDLLDDGILGPVLTWEPYESEDTHDRAVAAQALRDAADAIVPLGTETRAHVRQWLRDRADTLDQDAALAAAAPILTRQAVATLNGQWQAEQSEYIDRVVTAERERIATAIEAEAELAKQRALNGWWPKRMRLSFMHRFMAYRAAARIARAGGDHA